MAADKRMLYGDSRTWKRRLQDRMERSGRKQGVWHSLAYHDYFENYIEYRQMGADGRIHIVRQYAGPLYRQDLSKGSYIGIRFVYLLLFAALTGLLVLAGRSGAGSDSRWYMALAELGVILSLAYMGYILLAGYLFVPRQMTSGDYRGSSKALMLAARLLVTGYGLSALLRTLYLLSHPGEAHSGDWMAVCCFLAGAALAAGMYKTEQRIPYEITDADEALTRETDTLITYR